MVKKIFVSFIFILCCPCCRLHCEDCYSEYWQKLFWTMWENDSFALSTYVKLDSGNHLKGIRSQQFNEQFQWKVSDNFDLEVHYAYIHGHSVVSDSLWRWQHRLELEANPTFQLPCNCLIQTRNRLEIRRIENEPKTLYRLRQMTTLLIPFSGKGTLKAFSIYNELFYDISTRQFTEDRLYPFQVTFAISNKVDMDLFFLVRFFNEDIYWKKSLVIGTQLIF